MISDIFQYTDADGDSVRVHHRSRGELCLVTISGGDNHEGMVYLGVENARSLRDALTLWLGDGTEMERGSRPIGPTQTVPDQWAQVAEDIRAMRKKLEEGVAALTRADVLKQLSDQAEAERTAQSWAESAAEAEAEWNGRACGATYNGRQCTRVSGHLGLHEWDTQ